MKNTIKTILMGLSLTTLSFAASTAAVNNQMNAMNSAGKTTASHLKEMKQTLQLEYGSYQNKDHFNSNVAHQGFGVRFGQYLSSRFILELGTSYYSVLNFNGTNDNYNVYSTNAALKYAYPVSEHFSVIPYAGIRKNFASGIENSNNGYKAELSTTRAALGIQFQDQITDYWFASFNAGIDALSLGAGVSF